MERWVYDSDSGRPGRRRGLFVWLLDAAFAVVTALVALLFTGAEPAKELLALLIDRQGPELRIGTLTSRR